MRTSLRKQASRVAGRIPAGEVAPAYDPGQHTVTEVLAHVEQHPDQAQTIRDAEADGKARSTLLTGLDAQRDG